MYKLSFGKIYPEIETITKFQDIKGLELTKKSINRTHPVNLIGVENIHQFSLELDDECDYGIIFIDNQEIIKKVNFMNPVELEYNGNSLDMQAYLFGASKGVIKAWTTYFYNGVKEYNLWKNLKPSERQGWLE